MPNACSSVIKYVFTSAVSTSTIMNKAENAHCSVGMYVGY